MSVHSCVPHLRKRRAGSPPPSLDRPAPNLWPQPIDLPAAKRRRPNLANGFSGLSISRRRENGPDSPLPTYEESLATKHEVDDGDQTSWRSSQPDAIRVEDISDHRVKPLRGRRGSSDSSDTSVSVNDDADFRLPGSTLWRPAQQADEIEQPDIGTPRADSDVVVEDVTSQTPVRGRKRRDEEEDDSPRKRQRGFEMDIDEELGEGSRRRGRRRTQWHEPEKDRIVITSLGSPSSSRSTSSDRSCSSRHLTQPGYQGFTLSPSFLTHLIAAQRDQLNCDPHRGSRVDDRSLTLYRPRIPPTPDVVETWRGIPEVRAEDAGRFEEVDDDGSGPETMQLEVGSGDADMSMDVE